MNGGGGFGPYTDTHRVTNPNTLTFCLDLNLGSRCIFNTSDPSHCTEESWSQESGHFTLSNINRSLDHENIVKSLNMVDSPCQDS